MKNTELEKELLKEIEINKEKEKLDDTIKEINNQILKFIDTRKKVVDFILKYREKNLEEYRDDEDKKIDYFNHEIFVKEEQFKLIDMKLKQFTILKDSPYFGKIDFVDKYGEEIIYIGRFGVTSEDEYEPIVVDWRSPVSSLFYEGKLGDVEYTAPEGREKANILSKRQFIIKDGKLKGMFDSSLNVKDEILQAVLSQNSNQKLKNIVMTIQKEQDELIRQPRKSIMVVNGAAGSGKTTIALHRIAYLLYNYRAELKGKVLILGPNSIFMDYISTVLPSLGEEGVMQTTFREFASGIAGIDNILDFKEYMEDILWNKNNFKDEIMYKRSTEYINDLDSLISDIENNYFKVEDVKFYDEIIVKKSEIQDMLNIHFKYMPLFKRSDRIIRVIYSKIRDKRNKIVRKINEDYKKSISNLAESELNTRATNLEFRRKNAIKNVIEEVIKVKNEKLSWFKNPDIINIYNDFNNNHKIIYEDLAPILYLKIKLEGLKYNLNLRHIVIDEAQDYSSLEFIVIKQITNCKSFTIVGDTNQRIIPVSDKCDMMSLKKIFNNEHIKYFSMKTSYRSTSQIIEYANKYLDNSIDSISSVRSGKEVKDIQVHGINDLIDNIVHDIVQLKQDGYESIAVVCRSMREVKLIDGFLKNKIHIDTFDRENMIYSKGEVILPSYFAKGLEFDAVLMIDNFSISSQNENKLKYIMATRALHQLHVYKTFDIF
ncbi:AAA family ATPase [Clostridium tyrobutyricum]|jgi:DNA helicase-2/ATP-dependent DNA helicase PcrA|uniref:ATP-dependent DNA helicase rep n=2 Tax=Clostridium tyrobutyricum TaxID=1519 RepID=W6N6J8_CLOTY|nr:AAA family ATPase [Clostridium tyrobutyricum]AND85936.1 superfamily I DNA/RNA helicase [Clostridium tyrobutyricum]ANP70444.1 ATP-dependent DNA helicase [Clostridium tyrobutyricum]MBV4428151.1 AAA family ATPase [Clostridium tyrobutyricum]MBV4434991.1 AAA family ATPase [Clostridium tyrobutyricum]MBV4436257.1 AAA family ATPase [Clostridium tyrobutyricum]